MTSLTLVEYVSKIKFKPNTIEYGNKFAQKKKGKKNTKTINTFNNFW